MTYCHTWAITSRNSMRSTSKVSKYEKKYCPIWLCVSTICMPLPNNRGAYLESLGITCKQLKLVDYKWFKIQCPLLFLGDNPAVTYRVSRQLVLNFDFNFWLFWLSYQKALGFTIKTQMVKLKVLPHWYLQNSKNWVIFSHVEKIAQIRKKINQSSTPWPKSEEKTLMIIDNYLCFGGNWGRISPPPYINQPLLPKVGDYWVMTSKPVVGTVSVAKSR